MNKTKKKVPYCIEKGCQKRVYAKDEYRCEQHTYAHYSNYFHHTTPYKISSSDVDNMGE